LLALSRFRLLAILLGIIALVISQARGQESPRGSLQADLGRRIFFDARFSRDGRVACAHCHMPERAFSDGRPVSTGTDGRTGTRNAPSLVDVGEQTSFFWDGRRSTLEAQALDPLVNPGEHGMADLAAVESVLNGDAAYVAAFSKAFGTHGRGGIRAHHAASALAAFQRTLTDGESPFDRFLKGDREAIPVAARRGWLLFQGTAQCTRCHVVEGPRPSFTDHGFHALGIGLKGIERRLPDLAARVSRMHADGRLQDHSVLADADIAALGRFVVTLSPADIGKFKTPSLRNVALTAPYMHDGSVATLAEAVELEIYYRSTEDGRPLILTPSEKADLVAFLHALTGWRPEEHPFARDGAVPKR